MGYLNWPREQREGKLTMDGYGQLTMEFASHPTDQRTRRMGVGLETPLPLGMPHSKQERKQIDAAVKEVIIGTSCC